MSTSNSMNTITTSEFQDRDSKLLKVINSLGSIERQRLIANALLKGYDENSLSILVGVLNECYPGLMITENDENCDETSKSVLALESICCTFQMPITFEENDALAMLNLCLPRAFANSKTSHVNCYQYLPSGSTCAPGLTPITEASVCKFDSINEIRGHYAGLIVVDYYDEFSASWQYIYHVGKAIGMYIREN